MAATAGQRRDKYWKKNVIEREMVNGYLTQQKLLNRLRVLFPLVTSDDEFDLDTTPSNGWTFFAPCELDESEYRKLASKRPPR